MKLEIDLHQNRFPVLIVSHISLALLMALVFATPFIQMTGAIGSPFKPYRFYGYAVVAFLQLALVLGRGWHRSLYIFITPMAGILMWFVLSLAWAEHFDLSAKRILLISIVYMGVLGSVCDLGHQRSMRLLRVFLAAVLIMNFFVVSAFPDIGIHEGQGQWRGFLANKNIAGIVCATTIIVFLFDARRINLYIKVMVIAGSLLFLLMSWSRTPIIILPISCLIGLIISRLHIKYEDSAVLQGRATKIFAVFFAMSAAGMVILTIQRDFILSLTDNISAFSTRNAIWRPMILSFLDHPFLGSGYGSYWDGILTNTKIEAFSTTKWLGSVDQGHNGYLDILVQVGLPGLFLALYAAVFWPLTNLIRMISRSPGRAALIFGLIFLFLGENLTETSLFCGDVFSNVVLLFALAGVRRFELRSDKRNRFRSVTPTLRPPTLLTKPGE